MNKFKLQSKFKPTGDQPLAIKKLITGIKKGNKKQTLLGVTGSGKTFTMANVIAKLQRPTLIISHNKTLAAQLAGELQTFFPNNAVHYFVSYYDYYQPEAYIARSDTYIEKEVDINEEIDRLRHAATTALMTRKDVIIVASVSCIYGLGNPIQYKQTKLSLQINKNYKRTNILSKLHAMRYERNDTELKRNTFSVKGEIIDIYPSSSLDKFWRLRFFGNHLEKIQEINWLNKKPINEFNNLNIFPATHYLAPTENLPKIIKQIKSDLTKQLKIFTKQKKLLEAERLKQRINFDIEMMQTTEHCNGIENYSRYFDNRQPGKPAFTLIDYFPKDFLMFIDESHMTIPQIKAMYAGDKARKQTLVDFGFRLPSTFDNRPLTFTEFENKINQVIYVSATPGNYEKQESKQIVEQIIRPTGLLDPQIEIKPTNNQIDDLLKQIKKITAKKQRILVITLTKKMAEEISEYLLIMGIKSCYLHSEINTLERIEILKDLRQGKYDVLVGINLLREGLDLPEVSLVAILDADKEGFLRSETSLIQTSGRVARHAQGKVIMYADIITKSIKKTITETQRRRKIQMQYNKKHNIIPQTIKKEIKNQSLIGLKIKEENKLNKINIEKLNNKEIKILIFELENQMILQSNNMEFEKAAEIRDKIKEIKILQKIK